MFVFLREQVLEESKECDRHVSKCLGGVAVERPGHLHPAAVEAAEELLEGLLADIDVGGTAAGALVADLGLDRLAVGVEGDGLAAHGVAVGLGAHEVGGDGGDVLGVVHAGVVLTAGTETDSVVGDLTLLVTGTATAATVGRRRLDNSRLNLGLLNSGGLDHGNLNAGRHDDGRDDNGGLNLDGRDRDGLLDNRGRSLGGSGRLGRRRGRQRLGDGHLNSRLRGRGRRQRGGGGLGSGLGGGLLELAPGLRADGAGLGRRGGLDVGDEDGGCGLDVLGHILDLRNPLRLGDDVLALLQLLVLAGVLVVAVGMRLGGGGSDEERRGEGCGRLHFERGVFFLSFSVFVEEGGDMIDFNER